MEESISITQFIQAIEKLPSDEPFIEPGKQYRTQKAHWLGWLRGYAGSGAYGRVTSQKRDAKFAYNQIVEPKMLVWLIEASGTSPELLDAVRSLLDMPGSVQHTSAAIRKLVPWADVASQLFGQSGK